MSWSFYAPGGNKLVEAQNPRVDIWENTTGATTLRWTKPTDFPYTWIRFTLIGAGGGGGGGRFSNASISTGGGGGGGGGVTHVELPFGSLADSTYVTTFCPGTATGGAGKGSPNDGGPGTDGADATVTLSEGTILIVAQGGGGGTGGGSSSGGQGGGAAAANSFSGYLGMTGGDANQPGTANSGDGPNLPGAPVVDGNNQRYGGGAGGGGGSVTAAGVERDGGSGSNAYDINGGAGGAGGTAGGTAAAGATKLSGFPCPGAGGGGGGGNFNAAAQNAQDGGDGGLYGGGGGGGGGLNGGSSGTSGTGGDGRQGYVRIVSYV